MKKLIPFILALVVFIGIYSCKSDSTSPLTNVISFVMSHTTSGDTVWFGFKPSINVKLDSIQNKLPANNYSYTTNLNPTYTFSKDTTYYYEWFLQVTSGQKWEFYFFGTYPTDNSKFSNIKATYTIP